MRAPCKERFACAIVARDETNDERILADTPGRYGVYGRSNREPRSRAADWNRPQVQLAQGRLCRTAEKSFGHITGNRSLPTAALETSQELF
jgi:hypothetical protein